MALKRSETSGSLAKIKDGFTVEGGGGFSPMGLRRPSPSHTSQISCGTSLQHVTVKATAGIWGLNTKNPLQLLTGPAFLLSSSFLNLGMHLPLTINKEEYIESSAFKIFQSTTTCMKCLTTSTKELLNDRRKSINVTEMSFTKLRLKSLALPKSIGCKKIALVVH